MIYTLKRKLNLTVTKVGDSTPLLVTGALRVDFQVEKMIGNALNTGKFTIFNLAPDTVRAMSDLSAKYRVVLEVGNITDTVLTTLFDGELINIHNTPMYQDNLTTLWCWERGVKASQKQTPKHETIIKRKVKDIATDIVSQIKDDEGNPVYTIDFSQVTKGRHEEEVPVYTTTDSPINILRNLLGQRGMTFAVRNGVIMVVDTLLSEEDNATLATVSEDRLFKVHPFLLKKPVSFNIASAEVYYNLFPSVQPLDVMYIDYEQDDGIVQSQTALGDKALQIVTGLKDLLPRDYYFIHKIVHRGSLYTDEWETFVRGIIYNNTRTG